MMPYSVMSTLYQHMLASLVRELRKSTILGEQAKQTQFLMRDSTTHTHTARLDALPMKHVRSTLRFPSFCILASVLEFL